MENNYVDFHPHVDIEVHALSSLRRNQQRADVQCKLGKHRAKYFGELILSQKVNAQNNKQNVMRNLLSRVEPDDLHQLTSLDGIMSPQKSLAHDVQLLDSDSGTDNENVPENRGERVGTVTLQVHLCEICSDQHCLQVK